MASDGGGPATLVLCPQRNAAAGQMASLVRVEDPQANSKVSFSHALLSRLPPEMPPMRRVGLPTFKHCDQENPSSSCAQHPSGVEWMTEMANPPSQPGLGYR